MTEFKTDIICRILGILGLIGVMLFINISSIPIILISSGFFSFNLGCVLYEVSQCYSFGYRVKNDTTLEYKNLFGIWVNAYRETKDWDIEVQKHKVKIYKNHDKYFKYVKEKDKYDYLK